MNVTEMALPGVLLIEPPEYADERGSFMESFNAKRYAELGIPGPFVQDNVSRSRRGVLRGLHVQHPHSQGKLISVLEGEVYDVAVDVRFGSPAFARWCGDYLSADNRRQLYVPAGFAHGFVVTSDMAVVSYKCTEYYHPESELTVRWDDSRIRVAWPASALVLSAKDRDAPGLDAIARDLLPVYAR